jgi:hypothetical protein
MDFFVGRLWPIRVYPNRLLARCDSSRMATTPENHSIANPFGGNRQLAMKKNICRAVIEVGFIIFLFYSNLLMGEFGRSGMGLKRGMVWAIEDIFTTTNFEIAAIAAFTGYILLEFLRKQF